jgi:DNA-binding response OmpR family regulator
MVEDNETDFILTRNILSSASADQFNVRCVDRLFAALAEVQSNPPDIVLLDLSLPDSTGWNTFSKMRAAAVNVPVIVMTGLDDEQLAVRSLNEGAQDYLVKGKFGQDQLVRTIRYAIERQRAETTLRLYRDQLETLVESRSQELREANAQLRREIEEKERTQEQMRVTNSHLSKALVELKRTHEQVVRYARLEALGAMASGIVHDFNNILMPVVGYSDILIDTPEMLNDREMTLDLLKRIREAALNASDAVRRLRHFYKPVFNEGFAAVDLNALIGRALTMTQPRWKEQMGAQGTPIHIRKEFETLPPRHGQGSHAG